MGPYTEENAGERAGFEEGKVDKLRSLLGIPGKTEGRQFWI